MEPSLEHVTECVELRFLQESKGVNLDSRHDTVARGRCQLETDPRRNVKEIVLSVHLGSILFVLPVQCGLVEFEDGYFKVFGAICRARDGLLGSEAGQESIDVVEVPLSNCGVTFCLICFFAVLAKFKGVSECVTLSD